MSDQQSRGIYHKFKVERVDGTDKPGGKHENCDYFVLDITHDPFAIPALLAYAAACELTYPLLAKQLRERVQDEASKDWAALHDNVQ